MNQAVHRRMLFFPAGVDHLFGRSFQFINRGNALLTDRTARIVRIHEAGKIRRNRHGEFAAGLIDPGFFFGGKVDHLGQGRLGFDAVAQLPTPIVPVDFGLGRSTKSEVDWDDWRWHLRNRIKTKTLLSKIIQLTPKKRRDRKGRGQTGHGDSAVFRQLMDPGKSVLPVIQQSVPRPHDLSISPEEMATCREEKIHRYMLGAIVIRDRVLFLVSEMCAMYCRYCTRSGLSVKAVTPSTPIPITPLLIILRPNKEIRDVLDFRRRSLINERIPIYYPEMSRPCACGNRAYRDPGAVSMPQRITSSLVGMLKRYSPVRHEHSFYEYHREIIAAGCRDRLRPAGRQRNSLGGRTVLLKGINDNPEVMKSLMHELLKIWRQALLYLSMQSDRRLSDIFVPRLPAV